MERAIFISYRREDTEGEAGRLFDDLTRSFGDNSVFMDVAGINPGVDFRKAIEDNVASCGVLLALIGPRWAGIPDAGGSPRIDEPNDWVGLEIGAALARGVPVIPVLVHGATMPHPDQLPAKLKDLAYRNSVELTHARWNSDLQLLMNALKSFVEPPPAPPAPVRPMPQSQRPAPAPSAPAQTPGTDRRSSVPLVLGIVVAAVLAIGVVGFLIFRPIPPKPISDPAQSPVSNSTPTPAEKQAPAAPSVQKPAPGPDLSGLVGNWTNPMNLTRPPVPHDRAPDRLEISASGDQVSIHAYGKCQPADCDWGVQSVPVDGGQRATATFQFSEDLDGKTHGRTAQIAVEPGSGQLKVSIRNTYTDRGPSARQWMFVKMK